VLRRLLGSSEEGGLYARWESLALRVTLDTMPDVAYCPRCNAACVASGDDAQCAACFFTFCARCGERRHLGLDCVPAEDKVEQLLLEVEASASRERQSSEEAWRLEQRKVEELLSLREVLRTTRQCPSCRMAIAKTQGCNKMVCSNCGTFLCYRCGRAISGYGHFASVASKHYDIVRSIKESLLYKYVYSIFFSLSQERGVRAVRARRQEAAGRRRRRLQGARVDTRDKVHVPDLRRQAPQGEHCIASYYSAVLEHGFISFVST
jgi:predicted RNA-binding Zn-ribbon protein involved in translation (DUF1610 family)